VLSYQHGTCATPVSKCEAAKCGPNAGCFEDFADCTFENGQCGWSADALGWKLARSGDALTLSNGQPLPNPKHDHTFADNEAPPPKGHYFIAATTRYTTNTYLTTFTFPTRNVQAGLGCRFIFHFALAGAGSTLALRMSPAL